MPTQTFHFASPECVELQLQWSGADVAIDATRSRDITVEFDGPQELIDECLAEFTEGAKLIVSSGKIRNKGVSFHVGRRGFGFINPRSLLNAKISIPQGSSVSYHLDSGGSLYATGILDEVHGQGGSADVELPLVGLTDLKTGSGDITIDQVKQDLILSSGSGDLTVETVSGNANVRSGSGDIQLGAVAALIAQTGSGDITVGEASGELHLRAGSGDVTIDRTLGPVMISTASGDVTFNILNIPIPAVIRTASGDVCVTISNDFYVHAKVHTISGDVTNQLPPKGEPAQGVPFVDLQINTASGDIDLR